MLCGDFSLQRRVVFSGSAAAPVKTYKAILPGSRFSALYLRLVRQDAMRAVFDVLANVRINVYAHDKQFVQPENSEKARGRAR